MSHVKTIMEDRTTPRWARDIYNLLPIKSQFIFSGNIRDIFLIASEREKGAFSPIDFYSLLWMVLKDKGFKKLEIFDLVDGIRVFPGDGKTVPAPMTDEMLAERISKKIEEKDRVAIVIDFASRINRESKLFISCEKLATCLRPQMLKENNETHAFYNPIIWLFDNDCDIPSWYCAGNHRVHRLDIPKPDYDQRLKLAAVRLKRAFDQEFESSPPEVKQNYTNIFADMSEGFALSEMTDVANLARIIDDIKLKDIDDAVRSYKTGNPSLDNPWKSVELRGRIKESEEKINDRVRGQRSAVRHALDILKRSVMGLNGAHASSSNNRPRGVLFLAGPTGVGKTELAKALTYELFRDENAMIRFDMSEFSHDHSDARLLGAPPGYVGHSGGGELVNAIRQKPFSLVLFDEIEKANGKILDKFLQILEDGRITSGKGETVFFSECVIVFTSNLGIMQEKRRMVGDEVVVETEQQVKWTDDPAEVRRKIKDGVKKHFTSELRRPELLNRLGDNIVVFDFIQPGVADEIITKMLKNIEGRLNEERNATLVINPEPLEMLRDKCKQDLSNGGRGIGNCLETMLINPLSRALFSQATAEDKTVTIAAIRKVGGSDSESESYELDLQLT